MEHDSERLTKLLSALLPNRFHITVASNADIWERAMSQRPMDLLLIDELVSNDGGLALSRRARATGNSPAILLAIRPDEPHNNHAIKHDADNYLLNPSAPNSSWHELVFCPGDS